MRQWRSCDERTRGRRRPSWAPTGIASTAWPFGSRNASDAEEVAQDALWAASRKIDTFRGTSAFGSWVYRITANAAYQKLRKTRSQRHEVSWEDLVPSLDDFGQHGEVAIDWSRRLKDPAVEGELKRVLDRRAAGGLPHGLSPARCGRALEPRDRRDATCHAGRDQVAGAPGAALPAKALGRLHGQRRSDARRRWRFHIDGNSSAIAATCGAGYPRA